MIMWMLLRKTNWPKDKNSASETEIDALKLTLRDTDTDYKAYFHNELLSDLV